MDNDFDAFSFIHNEWEKRKNIISNMVGIKSSILKDYTELTNTARTLEELLNDALFFSPFFMVICKQISLQEKCQLYFGPENRHMLKSKKSLSKKIVRYARTMNISTEESLRLIGDSLRAMFVVDKPENIHSVVKALIQKATLFGWKISLKNYWEDTTLLGYLGVHIKIQIPLFGTSTKPRYLVCEIQIHINEIADGTKHSIKERQHIIYKRMCYEGLDPKKASAISKLLSLFALEKILQSSAININV